MILTAIFKDKGNIKLKLFYLSMLIVSIITILLSIQYSYATDYQPQGRYIYPIWIPIVLFSSIGMQSIFTFLGRFIKNKKILNVVKIVIYLICLAFFIAAIMTANSVLIASTKK